MSLYLYAVTDAASLADAPTAREAAAEGAEAEDEAAIPAEGIQGAPIDTLAEGDLAVVCSPMEGTPPRPRRKHLKAHHDTVRALHAHGPVLPMAFGVVADDEATVRAFLREHAATLAEQVEHVRGRGEVSFRARWDVDDIFAYFVARYDDLRALRDEMAETGEPSRPAMIALGEAFAKRLAAERQAIRADLEGHLADVCVAVAENEPRNETEAVNLALLVDRARTDDLDAAIEAAAEDFPDELVFRYTPPVAPYSFANVRFEG
jgi:hypothetical protein